MEYNIAFHIDILDNIMGIFSCQFQRKKKLGVAMNQHVRFVESIVLQNAWSMALSATVVECDFFICLFLQLS